MLNSKAFDKLLSEFGSAEKTEAYAKEYPLVAQRFAQIAASVGCLRFVSIQKQWELRFKEIKFNKFVTKETCEIDLKKMITEIATNSNNHVLDQSEVMKNVQMEISKEHNCWQISCGHDIIKLLSIAFCKLLGSKNTKEVAPDILELSLRLAYENAYFIETALYRAIRNWERSNPQFQIFVQPQ